MLQNAFHLLAIALHNSMYFVSSLLYCYFVASTAFLYDGECGSEAEFILSTSMASLAAFDDVTDCIVIVGENDIL